MSSQLIEIRFTAASEADKAVVMQVLSEVDAMSDCLWDFWGKTLGIDGLYMAFEAGMSGDWCEEPERFYRFIAARSAFAPVMRYMHTGTGGSAFFTCSDGELKCTDNDKPLAGLSIVVSGARAPEKGELERDGAIEHATLGPGVNLLVYDQDNGDPTDRLKAEAMRIQIVSENEFDDMREGWHLHDLKVENMPIDPTERDTLLAISTFADLVSYLNSRPEPIESPIQHESSSRSEAIERIKEKLRKDFEDAGWE